MALCRSDQNLEQGARAVVRCALTMFEELHRFNHRLAIESQTPLVVGIGIHNREEIIGRMGPPKTPILSAVGDSVWTRLRGSKVWPKSWARRWLCRPILCVPRKLSFRFHYWQSLCELAPTCWTLPHSTKVRCAKFVRQLGNRPSMSEENWGLIRLRQGYGTTGQSTRYKKSPAPIAFGARFWRRPTDSFAGAPSPAALAGLTVYPPASRHGVFSPRIGVPEM